MSAIVRFLMEKSVFAVVPVVVIIALGLRPNVPVTQKAADPWAAPEQPLGTRIAGFVEPWVEQLGIGRANATAQDGNSAAAVYQKSKISAVYARHRYDQKATARALHTDVAGLRRMLRRLGIIEWPQGHVDPGSGTGER